MKILGIKYTHDASVALIEDGRLRFSIELEKTGVACPRHPKMPERSWVDTALSREGMSASEIDAFAVDGWNSKRHRFVPSANYNEFEGGVVDPLTRMEFPAANLTGTHVAPYSSFNHATTHLVGSYALSPFDDDAVLITWDGGHSARAYLFEPHSRRLKFLGVLIDICASVYTNMGLYFGPYKDAAVIDAPEVPFRKFGRVEWPGKLMAWLATGKPQPELRRTIAAALDALPPGGLALSDDSIREHTFLRALRYSGFDDADVLASIQDEFGERFVKRATGVCPRGLPLVLSGGAALNIKWNAALRDCGHFGEVWAPPVANDSGSAIGVAVCEQWHRTGRLDLNWSVYSGPLLKSGPIPWRSHPLSAVADRLVQKPAEPVMLLRGRAEIGPRALGHRSIIASAIRPDNKDLLNLIKQREPFRPVAPVCLEHHAAAVFDPGLPDPFMVFEQAVREEWKPQIPAAVHLDGSARVQTVTARQEPFLFELLETYAAMTGIPVLLNTSANRAGAGFFDSLSDAAAWAAEVGINAIVAGDALYER